MWVGGWVGVDMWVWVRGCVRACVRLRESLCMRLQGMLELAWERFVEVVREDGLAKADCKGSCLMKCCHHTTRAPYRQRAHHIDNARTPTQDAPAQSIVKFLIARMLDSKHTHARTHLSCARTQAQAITECVGDLAASHRMLALTIDTIGCLHSRLTPSDACTRD